jgi:SAM-dependent methyltransferase
MSSVMLREARRRCQSKRLILVEGDAGQPLARPGEFDAATCFAALHLLDAPERVISTAATALHSGGLFFAWVVTARRILRPRFVQSAVRSIGLRLWEPGLLARRMHAHGFEIIETRTFGAIDFVVGARHLGGSSDPENPRSRYECAGDGDDPPTSRA